MASATARTLTSTTQRFATIANLREGIFCADGKERTGIELGFDGIIQSDALPSAENANPNVSDETMENTARVDRDAPARRGRLLVRLNAPSFTARGFSVRQQWEGVVESIGDEHFWCVLHDLNDPLKPKETAGLLLEDVSTSDRKNLLPGTIFYLIVGQENCHGTIRRISEIRLKRSVPWSKKTIEAASAEGTRLWEIFGDDRQGGQTATGGA